MCRLQDLSRLCMSIWLCISGCNGYGADFMPIFHQIFTRMHLKDKTFLLDKACKP